MIGRLLCGLGLHKVVTTREGKTTTGGRAAPRTTGAAQHIHCFCYRGCGFHVIVDTHSGRVERVPHDAA